MELSTDKVKKLYTALKEAIEIDSYGQRSEANESYKQFVFFKTSSYSLIFVFYF
jgi:hypothetical protein